MSRIFGIVFNLLIAGPLYAAEGAKATPSLFESMLPFLAMILIFYFLMMRPQIKKQKTHQEFLQKLKKGDRVLTSSGIFGTIEGLTDKYVKLEIADDVSIRVLKAHVSQPVKEN